MLSKQVAFTWYLHFQFRIHCKKKKLILGLASSKATGLCQYRNKHACAWTFPWDQAFSFFSWWNKQRLNFGLISLLNEFLLYVYLSSLHHGSEYHCFHYPFPNPGAAQTITLRTLWQDSYKLQPAAGFWKAVLFKYYGCNGLHYLINIPFRFLLL